MAKIEKTHKPKLLNKKRTSIGHSRRSQPKNKHARRRWKAYRGQG